MLFIIAHWFCLCILRGISDLKIGWAVLPVVVNKWKHTVKMLGFFRQLLVLAQEYRVGLLLIKDPKSCWHYAFCKIAKQFCLSLITRRWSETPSHHNATFLRPSWDSVLFLISKSACVWSPITGWWPSITLLLVYQCSFVGPLVIDTKHCSQWLPLKSLHLSVFPPSKTSTLRTKCLLAP